MMLLCLTKCLRSHRLSFSSSISSVLLNIFSSCCNPPDRDCSRYSTFFEESGNEAGWANNPVGVTPIRIIAQREPSRTSAVTLKYMILEESPRRSVSKHSPFLEIVGGCKNDRFLQQVKPKRLVTVVRPPSHLWRSCKNTSTQALTGSFKVHV